MRQLWKNLSKRAPFLLCILLTVFASNQGLANIGEERVDHNRLSAVEGSVFLELETRVLQRSKDSSNVPVADLLSEDVAALLDLPPWTSTTLDQAYLNRTGFRPEDEEQIPGIRNAFVLDLSLKRELLLLRSTPQPIESPRIKQPGVALLFMTYAGLEVPRLWEQWLTDAYNWIHANNLESESVPPDSSDVLRTFVHYFYGFDREYINGCAPPHLKEAAMKEVGRGKWGDLLPNIAISYETALRECPSCWFFIMVSHNSIPFKKFSEIYSDLIRDARSRMSIATSVYSAGIPLTKTSMWRTLIRPHAEATAYLKVNVHKLPATASEELWPMFLITRNRHEEDVYREIKCSAWTETNQAAYVHMSDQVCIHPPEHFECWTKWCGGEFSRAHKFLPIDYGRIRQWWLEELINWPGIFFGRKFTRDTLISPTLKGSPLLPLEDYMIKRLGFSANETTWNASCDKPPVFANLRNVNDHQIALILKESCFKGLRPEYRGENCPPEVS